MYPELYVEKQVPVKQGLRRYEELIDRSTFVIVEKQVPVKQGLRPFFAFIIRMMYYFS